MTSSVEPHRAQVVGWRAKGWEVQAIWQKLVKDHGFSGAYDAVWRFVQELEPGLPEATVRVEVQPGEEAQVDFGYVGPLEDLRTGKLRKCWAFVMTLSFSRHQYVEFVFDQTVETWLRLHRNAFSYFRGVPKRIVLDNLKAAIVKASVEDPEVQRSYRELAEHYDFLIAPCRPRTPEHKGKVESGVHYVQRNFMAVHEPKDIPQANEAVLDWIEHWAGQRIHGTTRQKPLERFRDVEQAALRSLPDEPYDLAVWNQLVVGRDCYVTFDQSYYSATALRVRARATEECGARPMEVVWLIVVDSKNRGIGDHMIASADGCHAGWVVALADCWPCLAPPHFKIHKTFQKLLDSTIDCRVIVVDMPIGLPTGAEHRLCDEISRSRLGAVGASRLFYAPPRPTLTAADPTKFQKLHHAITGKGAGLPVWGIVPKLRAVDCLMTPALHSRVREFHPELAWQYLAGTLLASKHTQHGLEQRITLLRHVPDLEEIMAPRDGLRRKDVKQDDLLDALVGLGVAQAIADGPDYSRRIPESDPERDERALRMEIWL